MQREQRRSKYVYPRLWTAVLVLAGALATIAAATTLPGKGPTASECYVTLKVEGTKAATGANKLECQDGDPTCDRDGDCHNNSCTFSIQACPNQPGLSGCTPSSLSKLKAHAKSQQLTAPLTGSACGALIDVNVALKGKKHTKPGKTKVILMAKATSGKPKVDKDKDVLVCTSRPATESCPTTTVTSTTVTSTTTTTLAVCGDGTVNGTEVCDPPGQQGGCATGTSCNFDCSACRTVCGDGLVGNGEQCDPPCGGGCSGGQLCNDSCQCVAQSACACGTGDPTSLSFTTTIGSGNCGNVMDASGATVLNLACEGLYFGGFGNNSPLPATTPDMGTSIVKACCSGTTLTLAPTGSGDVGATQRSCTAQGCLFGAPLPVQNGDLSTCVINVVSQPAAGSAVCDTGVVDLDLPLTSYVYLTGDIDSDGSNGIQPCPICAQSCSGGDRNGGFCNTSADCTGGGTCGGSNTCHFGPRNGMPCTPNSSVQGGVQGVEYPTTHDCPPGGFLIGTLPIPFALTTGTSSKTSVDLGTDTGHGHGHVFCGFCRDIDDTFCFEGDPAAGCPAGGGLHPCTADTDCSQPYEACAQRNDGAFGPLGLTARTISETGTPVGDLRDHAQHLGTLVSVFCIPPTFNAPIDVAADLPGPGAVALPGNAQAIP
jgi:hypothetical protein